MQPKTTAKDFFFHLGALVTLYVSFGALLCLLFTYINYLFPDVLNDYNYYDPYSGSMRFSISLLVVVFPLYVWLTYMINKGMRADATKRDVWVRRWGAYLTVFLASVLVAGDLIALLNAFLNGEITTRFILKVLAIAIVAGLTLWYYVLDIRGQIIDSPKTAQGFRYGALVVVFGSIIAGFFIVGSPMTAREFRFDEQKVSDLQNIQSQIVSYWQSKQQFPKSLDDLKNSLGYFTVPVDPETGASYEYTLGEGHAFKLCATFNKESSSRMNTSIARPVYPAPYYEKGNENWQHPAGHFCFDRTLDPELYPPYPNSKGI